MLILLSKSFVAEHLRYLKSGKSVRVQSHYTKRVKKHTEHALAHNHNLDHLSDKDKDLFNRMHAEQHLAEFYDGHALRKRVAHHETEAKKHNDHADELGKQGKHKEAAAARRKANKHTVAMHRHKADLKKVDKVVHGIAALKERLVAGSGKLEGDAESIHQHYVSKIGERLKPLPEAKEAQETKVLFVPKPPPNATPAPTSAIPANAVAVGEKLFTVEKIGRKWIGVKMGNGYKTKIAISPETTSYEVGGQYKANLKEVRKNSGYGTSSEFYVTTKEEKEKADIEKLLGELEGHAARTGKILPDTLSSLNMLGANQRPEYATRINAVLEKVKQAEKEAKEAKEAAKKARQESVAQYYKAKSKQVSQRVLFSHNAAPRLNTPIQMFGRWIVFDNIGQSFNINIDHPSTDGSHLLGHEGEKGAYYYYRDARPDEIPKADEKIPNETEKQTKAAAEPPVLFAAPQPAPNAKAIAAAEAALSASKGVRRVKASYQSGGGRMSFDDWVEDILGLHTGLMSPTQLAEAKAAYNDAISNSSAKAKKAVLSESAAQAKLSTVKQGGVALKGTPKQREWAEKIRQQRLNALTPDQAAIAVNPNGLFTNAKWWIETRDMDVQKLGAFFLAQKKLLALCQHLRSENKKDEYAKAAEIYNGLTGQFGFGTANAGTDYLRLAQDHLRQAGIN